MTRRIGMWALLGAGVAFLWFLYFTWLTFGACHGGHAFAFSAALETAVNFTAPVRPLFGHYPVTWYWSIVLNAAIYALIGLAVETIRLAFQTSRMRLQSRWLAPELGAEHGSLINWKF